MIVSFFDFSSTPAATIASPVFQTKPATTTQALPTVVKPPETQTYTKTEVQTLVNQAISSALARFRQTLPIQESSIVSQNTPYQNTPYQNTQPTDSPSYQSIAAVGQTMSTGSGLSELRSDIATGKVTLSGSTIADSTLSGANITSGSAALTTLTTTGNASFDTITTTGNVGIGTTTPGYALDILGNSALWQSTYGTEDGLLAYWPLSEATGTIAYDHSPYGHDAVISQTTSSSWTTGKYGSGIEFVSGTGSNGMQTYSYPSTPSTVVPAGVITGLTYELWVSSTNLNTTSNQRLIGKYAWGAWGPGMIVNRIGSTLNVLAPDSNQVYASITKTDAGITDGNWHHVVTTYSNSDNTIKLYVDGVLVGETSTAVWTGSFTGDWHIAVSSRDGTNNVPGKVDEVKIYNRALSQDEIKAHYLRNGTSNVAEGIFRVVSTATSAIMPSELLRVSNAGNLGIGTSSPLAQLSVNPNGITGPAFVIGSSTKTSLIVMNNGQVGINTTAPQDYLTITPSDNISYVDSASGNSQRARGITISSYAAGSYGDLRIGNYNDVTDYASYIRLGGGYGQNLMLSPGRTSTGDAGQILLGADRPNSIVQIGGYMNIATINNVFSSTTLRLMVNNAAATANLFNILNTGSIGIGSTTPWGLLSVNPTALGSGVPEFVVGSSTATHFIVNGAGNVGIGTAGPNYPLDVQAPTGQVQIKSTTGTNFALLRVNNTGGDLWLGREGSTGGSILTGDTGYAGILTAAGTYPLQFGVNNAVVMTMLSGGNVGIGTTSPARSLSVQGNSYVSGTSFFGGAITGTSSITMGADSYFNGIQVGVGGSGITTSNLVLGTNGPQLTTGSRENILIGGNSGLRLSTGVENVGVGTNTLGGVGAPSLTGGYNTAIGSSALSSVNGSGQENSAVGRSTGGLVTTGSRNTMIGSKAGGSITTGSGNVMLGYHSGKYATGDQEFYVDNQDRTNAAGDKLGALLYGTFSATPSSQTLTINASTSIAQNLQVLGTGNNYFAGNVGIGTTSPGYSSRLGVSTAGQSGINTTGIYSVTAGGSNSTNYGGYFSATGSSNSVGGFFTASGGTYNWAIKGVGKVDFSSATMKMSGVRDTAFGSLWLADTTSGFSAGQGADITFAGDDVGQGSECNIFANIKGIKENSNYANPLGAIVLGTQSSSSHCAGLSTVTEKMRIDSGGNVGIGTTSPYTSLAVAGASGVLANIFTATSTTATSTFAGGVTLATGGGFVGVGTTNPTANLEVSGYNSSTIRIISPNGTGGETTSLIFATNGNPAVWESKITNYVGEGGGVQDLRFYPGGFLSTVMQRVTGNVGIGTTTPWGKLSVTQTGTGGAPAFIVEDSASPDTTPFVIDQSGNVGIGTTSPADKLHVEGSVTGGSVGTGLYINNFAGAINDIAHLNFGVTNVSSTYQKAGIFFKATGTSGRGDLHFALNNVNNSTNADISDAKLTILSTGNVGIGTTTPDIKFEVHPNATYPLSYIGVGSGIGSPIGSGAILTFNQYNATSPFYMGVTNDGIFGFDGASRIMSVSRANSLVSIGTTNTPGYARLWVRGLSTDNNPVLQTSGSDEAINFSVMQTGAVGIGSTTPSARLGITQTANTNAGGIWLAATDGDYRAMFMDTAGVLSFNGGDGTTLNTATLNAAGAWSNASDISYKNNIQDLGSKYGLDTVMKTTPRSYTMKGSNLPQVGFIAQELKPLIPEVVDGTDGSMGISYGNLVAVAFQAIKELNQKVTDLQSQMKNFVFDKLTAKIAYVDEANIKKLTVTDTSFEGRVMFNDKSSLCVDNVCLTKDQLKQMILERGATTYGSAADQMKGINPLDVPTTPVVDTTPVTTTATTTPVETATSTAPVVSTTPIVETIVATTTPIITPTPVEATTTPITISVPETPVVTPTSASTTETTI